MDHHVVDAAAAEGQAVQGLSNALLVPGEQIQRQRLGLRGKTGVERVIALKGENGQNRSKNFLPHHGIAGGDAIQHGRGDLQRLPAVLAADDSFFAVQQAQQTLEVLLVHNSTVVWVFQRLRAVLGGDLPLQLRYQGILYLSLAQHIVRGHAGLTAVEIFPKDDPTGRQGQVGSGVYDAGTLAPQLQHSRRQGLGGMPQYLPSYRLTAGEKHQVKPLFQQRAVLLTPTGDHRHVGRIKGLPDQLFDYGAGGGGVGAGLDHGGVAGGNGVSQGIYGQEEGVVPWAHN